MIERELAWRVFAHEFNNSHHFFHEGDERSPNYLVTPTGARINRLYFVGVLTEIENIGVGEDMWRGRVSDHTGGFTVYAGQYQPEAAMFLSGLEVPSFVAVVGKARTYEPEKGTIYTSVRPEELNMVDGRVRDRWIVETARLTFDRIRFVRTALESGLKGPQCVHMLIQSGASAELADGINRAIEHYPDLNEYLDILSGTIIESLRTLLPDTIQTDGTTEVDTVIDKSQASDNGTSAHENTPSPEAQPDSKELVYELLGILDKGRGVPVSELTDRSGQIGLAGEQVNDALKGLMSEGRCYEPRIGILRRV